MKQVRSKRSVSELAFGRGSKARVSFGERLNLIQERVSLSGWKRIEKDPKLRVAFSKRYHLHLSDVERIAKSVVRIDGYRQELVGLVSKEVSGFSEKLTPSERKNFLSLIRKWAEKTKRGITFNEIEKENIVLPIIEQINAHVTNPKRRRLLTRLILNQVNPLKV